ncbi:MAG: nucleoside hydrolase-like domain-containing protein [Opitutaceae bacterium]
MITSTNRFAGLIIALSLTTSVTLGAVLPGPSPRSRMIILDDYGCEPDEEQQVGHLLMYSNEMDIEGLLCVAIRIVEPPAKPLRPDLAHRLIDGYAKVYPNLQLHAIGWPTPDYLHSIVANGQRFYGLADAKLGNSSAGSQLIVKALDKADPRPIWVILNAGSNTLAQALMDYRATHTPPQVRAAITKLRVFDNGAQDSSGAWICSQFPAIHWLRSNSQTYAYGGPGPDDITGNTNLGPHYWHPYAYSPEGQRQWMREHVQTNHGALGELIPDRRWPDGNSTVVAFMEGGGTTPFLGLANKGLFDIDHPSWGGWSGRFTAEKVADCWSHYDDIRLGERKLAPFYMYQQASDTWTDPQDGTVYEGDSVPVWRCRSAMYADYICRMEWCVKPYNEANHPPVAAIDGDTSPTIVRMRALSGSTLRFDASASTDPDGDQLTFSWWIYEEAGTYPGRIVVHDADHPTAYFTVPSGAGGKQIHLILEVKDNGKCASLAAYRRIVIDVD